MPERYRLALTGPASRGLDKAPERTAVALIEFMTSRLLDNPQRIGKPLRGDFAGLYAARLQGYRVRYRIDDEHGTVVVVHVGPRADAYRPE